MVKDPSCVGIHIASVSLQDMGNVSTDANSSSSNSSVIEPLSWWQQGNGKDDWVSQLSMWDASNRPRTPWIPTQSRVHDGTKPEANFFHGCPQQNLKWTCLREWFIVWKSGNTAMIRRNKLKKSWPVPIDCRSPTWSKGKWSTGGSAFYLWLTLRLSLT